MLGWTQEEIAELVALNAGEVHQLLVCESITGNTFNTLECWVD